MTTLLESGARPYGSTKGVALSMLLHGTLIAAAIFGTAQVVLPPREKVEEHPILYVAAPPPPPVHVAPEPLKIKTPPKAKASPAPKVEPPRPKVAQPQPQPQPKVPDAPALVAPAKVSVSIPAVDMKATPTISDVVGRPAPPSEPITKSGGVGSGAKSDDDGSASRGGLGSGDAGRAYSESQVERAVEVTRPATPRYPDALKSVGVEGTVRMRFIVGTDGKVESGSIEVLSSPHKLFADAVRTALLNTRYRPAEAGGHAVRQLVEQSFGFKIDNK